MWVDPAVMQVVSLIPLTFHNRSLNWKTVDVSGLLPGEEYWI